MAAYNVHDCAVANVVNLRGGLEHLGMKGVLAHVIRRYVRTRTLRLTFELLILVFLLVTIWAKRENSNQSLTLRITF